MNKKKLLKTAARLASPHLAGAMLGRKKSPLTRAADWASGHVVRRSAPAPSMGSTALKGLGAAAVALPLGMWLGRKLRDRS